MTPVLFTIFLPLVAARIGQIQQIRNHFESDPIYRQLNLTWTQEYLIDKTYFKKNPINDSIVFLNLGGDGEQRKQNVPLSKHNRACNDYAEDFNAICLYLEHRYFLLCPCANDSRY